MKYSCQTVGQTKAIVELIPEDEKDQELLNLLDIKNPEHEMTFHHHYQRGLQSHNASAQLMLIDSMIEHPKKALISFKVAKGMAQ